MSASDDESADIMEPQIALPDASNDRQALSIIWEDDKVEKVSPPPLNRLPALLICSLTIIFVLVY